MLLVTPRRTTPEAGPDLRAEVNRQAGAQEALHARVRAEGEALARQLEALADEAERFAALLERVGMPGDPEGRLPPAARERDVAGIARHNAARLRDPGSSEPFERYPSFELGRAGTA